ncbi:dihydroneopterin aldolase [Malaciobacter mytili]|uniref:dihydroneopterin aldolase n=1 Tax=Malaciobacter mytili TaxID=603050 RepID=UPI003A850278
MKIKIKDLTFNCIIGILPFEREMVQQVVINCKIKYKYKNSEFIDYSLVAKDIETIMIEKKFDLIEDALLYLKRHLRDKYNVTKLKLTICKPQILPNCKVSVTK